MKTRITIASPPDRQNLVAEIFVENEQLAEINTENDEIGIEIYKRENGEPWKINYQSLVSLLEDAKSQLLERS